jgi:hypothetical protein
MVIQRLLTRKFIDNYWMEWCVYPRIIPSLTTDISTGIETPLERIDYITVQVEAQLLKLFHPEPEEL